MSERKLTDTQVLFVKEYLVDQNATQAAIRAGYSKNNADKIGSELLGKPRVRAAIDEGLAEKAKRIEKRARKFEITKERWVREVAKIAFSNIDEIVEVTNHSVRIIPTKERHKYLGKVIKKISESTSQFGGSRSIELHPKLPALEMLAKHFGWIEDTIVQKSDPNVLTGDELVDAMRNLYRTEKAKALSLELAEELEAQYDKEQENKNGKD